MRNDLLPQKAKIVAVRREAPNVKVFTLKPERRFVFQAGQFINLAVPGVGEAPFAFCSSQYNHYQFQIAVQEKGVLTNFLFGLKKGAQVGVRGPFGRGFPLERASQKNLLIVAGGVGIAPLRSVVTSIIERREVYRKVQFFYGTRCEEYRIFESEFPRWRQKKIDLEVTLDQCQPQWHGDLGVITTLFDKYPVLEKAIAFIVGPPIMNKFVLGKLQKHKFKDEEIYLSLERRMHCGIGICQHCALTNGQYVCKDGPVFSWAEIKNLPNVI